MNAELQKTRDQIVSETNRLWNCAVMEDYRQVVEQAEMLLVLAKHAQEIKEREAR